jgi:sodium transport system permease protein
MNRTALIVFLKEWKETVRDKRALSMLALFVLMYPLMVGALLHNMIGTATKPEREGIELVVIGAAKAPTLMAQLRQKNVQIKDSSELTEDAIGELLHDHKVVAVLRLTDKFTDNYAAMRPAEIELWIDSASDARKKQRDVEDVLQEYGASIASARLLAHGVSPAALNPIRLQRFDTATSASRSASIIGTKLGSFFIPAFIFCLSTAIDSSAGERERRSLEVLMAQPARALDLIVGKWLAAGALSVLGITLELSFAHAILAWLPLEEIGMSWRLTGANLALVCLATIPLSLFAAALEIALAMNAKSFKEAQSTVSFVIILPMIPVFVVPMLDLNTANWMYLVPVLSNQTLLRELAKGQDLGLLPFALTFASSSVLALLAVGFASWRMNSERYVLSV